MAAYRIRNLYCVMCDTPRRTRNQIIDGAEIQKPCFECNTPLMVKPDIDLDLTIIRKVDLQHESQELVSDE